MLTFSAHTEAPPHDVFAVLTDVADWPHWTASMDSVQRLDTGPLRVGSTARIRQPKLGENTFEVTALTPEAEFTWVAHNTGVTTIARHVLTPKDGGTRIELSLEHRGPLAWLARLLTDKTSRAFIAQEGAGLKAAAEARTVS